MTALRREVVRDAKMRLGVRERKRGAWVTFPVLTILLDASDPAQELDQLETTSRKAGTRQTKE